MNEYWINFHPSRGSHLTFGGVFFVRFGLVRLGSFRFVPCITCFLGSWLLFAMSLLVFGPVLRRNPNKFQQPTGPKMSGPRRTWNRSAVTKVYGTFGSFSHRFFSFCSLHFTIFAGGIR